MLAPGVTLCTRMTPGRAAVRTSEESAVAAVMFRCEAGAGKRVLAPGESA
jgi:hypothetical protein